MPETPPTTPTRKATWIMASAPLFPVALGTVSGIIMDGAFALGVAWYLGLIAVVTAALLTSTLPKFAPIMTAIAFAGTGGLLHASFERWERRDDVERLATSAASSFACAAR